MTHDPETPARVDLGTNAWQPEVAEERQAYAMAYLERVAGMPLLQRAASRALELLALSPGQAVLEVGCGNGVFLPRLAQAVGPIGRVVGIDHAEALVTEARALAATRGLSDLVRVEVGDAYHLPFPDGSFDAAHCERVLMHLEHPTAALREMHRVIRPGGRIVAAEPDWEGLRIDHPDREAVAVLVSRWLTRFRQPNMGLSLARRFAEVGLIERRVIPEFLTEPDLETLKAYGLDLRAPAGELIREGLLSPDRVEAALTHLESAAAEGSFYHYGPGMFIAVGSRAFPQPDSR